MRKTKELQIDHLVQSIGKVISGRQELARRAELQYKHEVEQIIREQIQDAQRIERLLDLLLDFDFDPAMLGLYKRLCRHYYQIDPQAVLFYVNAYREMWGEKGKKAKRKS